MARDLKGKKMPMKPMKESAADEELELDMPMSDEEMGSEEADADMLPMDEGSDEQASELADISDDDLIAEFKLRGLSLDDEAVADEESADVSEEPAPEEEQA